MFPTLPLFAGRSWPPDGISPVKVGLTFSGMGRAGRGRRCRRFGCPLCRRGPCCATEPPMSRCLPDRRSKWHRAARTRKNSPTACPRRGARNTNLVASPRSGSGSSHPNSRGLSMRGSRSSVRSANAFKDGERPTESIHSDMVERTEINVRRPDRSPGFPPQFAVPCAPRTNSTSSSKKVLEVFYTQSSYTKSLTEPPLTESGSTGKSFRRTHTSNVRRPRANDPSTESSAFPCIGGWSRSCGGVASQTRRRHQCIRSAVQDPASCRR
jgi:hypothetical protein